MYHTSAIIGASIDTMTLPYRLENNPSLMSHVTDALTQAGRKVKYFELYDVNCLIRSILIIIL